jgi:hypothetical protein
MMIPRRAWRPIRQAAALAKLPAQEQAACKKLWADVAALHQRAAAKP